MTDREASVLYTDLLRLLREQGLGWIAEQIEYEVSLGKPDKKQVDEIDYKYVERYIEGLAVIRPSEDFPGRQPRQRRRKVEFPATVEFSPRSGSKSHCARFATAPSYPRHWRKSS
jgi:hypothetical protein